MPAARKPHNRRYPEECAACNGGYCKVYRGNVVNDEQQLNTSPQITEIQSGPIVHYSSQALAHQDNNHFHQGMTQISNQASYQTTPQVYPIQFGYTSLQDNNLFNHQNQLLRFNDTSQFQSNNLSHNTGQFPEVTNQNTSTAQDMLPHVVNSTHGIGHVNGIGHAQYQTHHPPMQFITQPQPPPSPMQANIHINNNLQRQSSITSQPLTDQQGIKNCICQDLQNCGCQVCKSILSNHRNQNKEEPKNETIATRNEDMNVTIAINNNYNPRKYKCIIVTFIILGIVLLLGFFLNSQISVLYYEFADNNNNLVLHLRFIGNLVTIISAIIGFTKFYTAGK